MTNKQLKKRKERERRVADKLRNVRLASIKAEKQQRLEDEGVERPKIAPFHKRPKEKMAMSEVQERLRKNLEILKVLEEEFKREHGPNANFEEHLKKTSLLKAASVEKAIIDATESIT